MPVLTCPDCGEQWTHTGKATAPTCPRFRCETRVPVGVGRPSGRDLPDAGD
jgi:hypothetical protein